MSAKMSQKEYLKKYLSGGSDKKKKKKDKKAKSKTSVKIIDDDLHCNNHLEIDEELLLTGEDAPQIVGIVDASGETKESKWKRIGSDRDEEKSSYQNNEDDLWGKKATSHVENLKPKQLEKKQCPIKIKMDQSPPRRKSDKRSHQNGDKSSSKIEKRSPVRRSRWNSEHLPSGSASKEQAEKKSDQSPPRNRSQFSSKNDSDESPSRRRGTSRRRKDSDQSPPRKSPARASRDERQSLRKGRSLAHLKVDSDQSPPRRRSPVRSRKDSDQSPPRKRTTANTSQDSDQSPPRRRSDKSPPRRQSGKSPPRRQSPVRSRKDSDQSPPRKRSTVNPTQDSDQSPPRRRIPPRSNRDSDQSPPRRRSRSPRRHSNSNPFKTTIKQEKLSVDNSPRRYKPRPNSSQSPELNRNERRSESPPPTHKNSSKMSKTLDGKRAGLQDAKTLKIETEERRRHEDRMFNKMSKEISGRDAEVQVRQSSSYRRRRRDQEEDPEVQRKKAEHEEKKKELYNRWNRGVKQIEDYKAKVSDDQYESNKPLARYANDADLDEMLRQKEREDDPMLEYIRSKKKDQQESNNKPVIPKYKGSYPENRFGIPPGYRWDGVDRSNGYEKKWFDVQSRKEAVAEEAYKYSTEDL